MNPTSTRSRPSVLAWILCIGGSGFLVGFIGPVTLRPDSNQGPLLGIIYTGPLATCLGLVLCVIVRVAKLSPVRQWQTLALSAMVTAFLALWLLFYALQHW